MIKSCKLYACPNGTLGLHLTRAPWDPYPWISGIQKDSSAAHSGMRMGDTVLEINDSDVLGQRIIDIAEQVRQHWQSGANFITIVIWRTKTEEKLNEDDTDEDIMSTDKGKAHINQQSLQKFATCLQHISQLLECPVCLEIIRPPSWQCCNGHVLCNNCRSRSVKCPVCRVPLGPRGRCLLADKLFCLLAESFPNESQEGERSHQLSERKKSRQEFCDQDTKALDAKSSTKKINESKLLERFRSRRHEVKSNNERTISQVENTTNNNNVCRHRNGRLQDTSPARNSDC